MQIRSATARDAARIRTIYAPYVKHTAITFEYRVPSPEEFSARIAHTLASYPNLVATEGNEIVGYAYASPLDTRPAYCHLCEVSIYLSMQARGRGIGRALYTELEEQLRKRQIRNLYACIADPLVEDEYLTRDSEHFHAHMGFTKVGTFHLCGYKFGRWYNVIWMEKLIGEHARPSDPPPLPS